MTDQLTFVTGGRFPPNSMEDSNTMINTRKSQTAPKIALVAMLVAGMLSVPAYAETTDQDHQDLAAASAMKVSLSEAITTAERQTGGRAVGADISERQGAHRIAVEIAGPTGITTVMVDGMSGQVVPRGDDRNDD